MLSIGARKGAEVIIERVVFLDDNKYVLDHSGHDFLRFASTRRLLPSLAARPISIRRSRAEEESAHEAAALDADELDVLAGPVQRELVVHVHGAARVVRDDRDHLADLRPAGA